MSSSLSSVLSYLTHLFEMGKSYSKINLHRSMLSMKLGPIDHFQVGSHPLVVKLLRAAYNLNPPKPKYHMGPKYHISNIKYYMGPGP
jgi:hypothetical protein